MTKMRAAYDEDYKAEDYATPGSGPDDVCHVQQQFKDECDINTIMAKYQEQGLIDHVSKWGGRYGDATSNDFTQAMFTVTNAQNMFNDLPSKAREFFANDPARFLSFIETADPDNSEHVAALADLGLLEEGSELWNTLESGNFVPTEDASSSSELVSSEEGA